MNSVETSIVFLLTHFYVPDLDGLTLTWNQVLDGPVGVFLRNPQISPWFLFETFREAVQKEMGVCAFFPGNQEYPPVFRIRNRFQSGPSLSMVSPMQCGLYELSHHSSGEKVLFHRHPFGKGNIWYYHSGTFEVTL